MSTFTSSLGLEEIAPGTQAGLWGDSTNNNLNLIDQAVTGVTPLSFAGLSGTVRVLESSNGAEDEARSAVLDITGGATGANTVVVPNKQKTYLVRNFTGQQITFRTATPNAPAIILSGNNTLIFCDGNNNVFLGIVTESVGPTQIGGGGTGVTTYAVGDTLFYASGTTLSRLPIGPAGHILTSSGTAPQWSSGINVANGGTGRATLASGALLTGDGTNPIGTIVGSANGEVLTYNGSSWVGRASGLGAGNFTNTNITVNAQGIITAVSTGSGGSGITSVSGSNTITANTSGGTATISQTSQQAINALGYTPGTGNVSTNTNNTFTSGVNTYSGASITMQGSVVGDQRIQVTGAGLASGLAPGNIQIGTSNTGVIYSPSLVRLEYVLNGGMAFFANSSGNFQGNNSATWAQVSDINIKTNLRPISNVLDKINALKPCHFEYKDELGKTRTGFIAQEFATVFPGHTMNIVADDKQKEFLPEGQTELTAIDANLTAYLVKAIQELSAKVDAQAAEITALKAQ